MSYQNRTYLRPTQQDMQLSCYPQWTTPALRHEDSQGDRLHQSDMPIYFFQTELDLDPQVVSQRLKAVAGTKPRMRVLFFWPKGPKEPKFLGTVKDDSFRLVRNIGHSNSFLPRVWGRLRPIPGGTRVEVTMFLHPFVALFMAIWLGIIGYFALTNQGARTAVVLWYMFAFGVIGPFAVFLYEAIRARKALDDALRHSSVREPYPRFSDENIS